jgi:O-antigen/teichoic acid export membrane protein
MQWRFNGHIHLREARNSKLIGQSYQLGLRAFISEYLILLLMRLDLIILKAMGSYTQVGIYTLAVNFVDIINMSCNMIGAVLLVKLSSLKDDIQALGIMRRIFLMIGIINTVAILGMVVFGKWFIVMLYGEAYVDAYAAFLLLIPAIYGITLGALFNTFLWSKGFPLISILAPIGPLLLKLGLNYLLVPDFGLFGTSIASSICYPLWFAILLAWYFLKHPQNRISLLIPRREDFGEMIAMAGQGYGWVKLRLSRSVS